MNGLQINAPDATEVGYGVWRLTQTDIERLIAYRIHSDPRFVLSPRVCGLGRLVREFSIKNIIAPNFFSDFVRIFPLDYARRWENQV